MKGTGNRNYRLFAAAFLLLQVIPLAGSAHAAIYVQNMPLQLVASNQPAIAENTDPAALIALEWVGDGYGAPPAVCELRYRASPGSQVSDYTLGPVAQTEQGLLKNFTPNQHGMTGGVYYCIIAETGSESNYSQEFVLYVESPLAPVMLLPANGSHITSATPEFSWNKVLGVPYTMLVVTDQQIILQFNPETGAPEAATSDGSPITPVWQVITSEDSMVYGTPDPSGYFGDHFEPLLGGTTYTWIVLNCYANNPAYVSQVVTALYEFTFIQDVNLPVPSLTHPPSDEVTQISSETITFTWDGNWDASYDPIVNFHIFAYIRENTAGGLSGAILAWDATTSNGYYDADARTVFTSAVYDWKIIAMDSQGRGRKSGRRTFNYYKPVGTIAAYARYYNAASGQTEGVPAANLEIEPVSGGSTYPFPFITDIYGNLSVQVVPGTYRVTASKDSFETVIDTVSVSDSQTAEITLMMEKSPCFITGDVRDEVQNTVPGARVDACRREAPFEQKTVYTDSSGIFRVTAKISTSWDIAAGKVGYSTASAVNVQLSSYPSTLNIGTLGLVKSKNTIMGAVVNEYGYPVSAVTVSVTLGTVEWSVLTDDTGSYQFKVNDGTWTLTAEKTGFVPPSAVSVPVFLGGTENRQLVLTSQANMVTGSVTDNQKNISGALVKALDPLGSTADQDTTDVFGIYSLNLAGGGTYDISASKQGYTSGTSRTVVFGPTDSGQTVSGVNFVLSPNDSHITGTVTTDGAAPLEGASVTDGESIVLTAADGTFDISTTEGTFDVNASKEGYSSPGAQQVTLAVGETVSGVNFVLSPNASVIKGKVYSGGQPVYDARVSVSSSPAGSELCHGFTGGTGAYTVSLDAGTWYLHAGKNRFLDSDELEVSVAPGQVSEGNDMVIVYNVGTLEGRVVNESASAVRNAAVTVREEGVTADSGITDTSGGYSFTLDPGSYTVTVEKTGYRVYSGTVTYLVTQGNTVSAGDIELEKTSYFISGRVTGPGGAYLKNVLAGTSDYAVLTDINGYYLLNVNEGSYGVWARKNGYSQAIATQTVSFSAGSDPDGTVKTADFIMEYDYSVVAGTVTTGSVTPVEGATVTVSGVPAVTDAGGVYSLPVIPGWYSLSVNMSGYQQASSTTYVGAASTKAVNFDLVQAAYSVNGTVNDESAQPVPGVTVRVDKQDGSTKKSALTAVDGTYGITGLANGGYDISITKNGYSFSSGASSLTVNSGNITGMDFTLDLNDDTISVTVRDGTDGALLEGAEVIASGDTPGTQGYGGSSVTSGAGTCAVGGLKAGKYTLKSSRNGYKVKVTTGVDSGGSETVYLDRNYGSISGAVSRDGQGIGGVSVSVDPLSGSFQAKSTHTLAGGAYTVQELLPGEYMVTVSLDSHYSMPLSREVTVAASSSTAENVAGADFTVVYASITSVDMVLPQGDIFSNLSDLYQLQLVTRDTDGRIINGASPQWGIEPPQAGSISAEGILDVSDNYFGEAVVSVAVGDNTVEENIAVYFKVVASTYSIEVADSAGMKLIIPANVGRHPGMTEDKVTVESYEISAIRMISGIYRVNGSVYNLKPDGFTFSDDVEVSIPVEGIPDESLLSVGRWEQDALKWVSLGGTASGGYVTAATGHFSEYAVLVGGEELSLAGLTLMPNPFSPAVKPVEFRYYPASNSGSRVSVEIRVYNMIGDFVRTVLEEQFQNVGEAQTVSWDGNNSDGEPALNGRYIVDFRVEDGTGVMHYLKPVVLIK